MYDGKVWMMLDNFLAGKTCGKQSDNKHEGQENNNVCHDMLWKREERTTRMQ